MFHMVSIEGVVVCKAIRELDVDGREASLHQFQIDQQTPGATISVDEGMKRSWNSGVFCWQRQLINY